MSVHAGGRIICERCAIADTAGARMRGLLGRDRLDRGEGVLLQPAGSIHTFFMSFPIDAIFLDREMRVVGVAPNLVPWRAAARRRAHSVLELAAGEIEARAVRLGERLCLVDAEPAHVADAPRERVKNEARAQRSVDGVA